MDDQIKNLVDQCDSIAKPLNETEFKDKVVRNIKKQESKKAFIEFGLIKIWMIPIQLLGVFLFGKARISKTDKTDF